MSSRSHPSLFDALEKIAQARRELWWFIETYSKEYGEPEDDEIVMRAMAIQDDLLYPAFRAVDEAIARG